MKKILFLFVCCLVPLLNYAQLFPKQSFETSSPLVSLSHSNAKTSSRSTIFPQAKANVGSITSRAAVSEMGNIHTLDVQNLQAGNHIVRSYTENQVAALKIIKK